MTISEVCKQYDITADTLRYYERIGLIPRVPRTAGGIRDYDEESCNWISLMKCMRRAGVQIEALVDYVALFQQGGDTLAARREILAEQRTLLEGRIGEMQASLELLKAKIARYDSGEMAALERKFQAEPEQKKA